VSIALYALAALLVLDALRLRGRVGRLGVLVASDERASHVVVAAPGVTIDDATARAASAYMRDHGVEVLELLPRDVPAIDALVLAQLVDPAKYRADRLAPGRTAGHAVVVTDDIAARAQIAAPADAIAFAQLATRLKHYGAAELAIAPAEHARRRDVTARYATLYAMLGPSTAFALAALPILLALLATGIAFRPLPGLIALAAWQLQPALVLTGTKLSPRDLAAVVLLRAPLELAVLARTLLSRRREDHSSLRAEYARAFADGLDRFYEARRETCPLCGSRDLAVHLRHGDMFQHKPGTFTLERCRACRHLFQNPRLTPTGLDIYYKDFYDGLGEAGMEYVFGFAASPYLARARAIKAVREPGRWLDVGAGHGHFCMAARAELPATRFDGLDLSSSIDEAQRRGWIETGYRGLFPEIAPTLAGRYDAISMSHYLEHTLDPRSELEAAHTALADGGCLLIEVPDPEFALGRVLRRYWLPWFQPQHLHLLSVSNLERLLVERGFLPVVWHRGAAHQRVDFFFATYLLLDRIAPSAHLPWRPRGRAATAWRLLAWSLGSPLLLAAIVVDNALGPFLSRARVSNTYRVVAQKSRRDAR
jgi:SAM-dependent methyltransferase